ncbi:MAG TPA: phage protease [Vicinamibacterales bacterium]|nr:phage protease [Vicinamibacterales bacterium]
MSITILNAGAKLPESRRSEIQIAPVGEYPGYVTMEDGERKPVTQRLAPGDLARIVAAFDPARELLVDADHESERGGSTEAFGWIGALRVDDDLGLMAEVNWTGLGAEAVEDRRFRYVSPVFEVDLEGDDVAVPTLLVSVALTNKPNLPVRCVLNRAQDAGSTAAKAAQPKTQRMQNMDKLKEALGLAPDAADEDVLAAVVALKAKLAELDAAAMDAEAEAFAAENKDKVCNAADLKAAYLANPAVAKAIVANVKAVEPAPQARVTNSADAKKPVSFDALRDVLTTYNSLAGEAKRKYLRENAEAIHAARVAAENE